MSSSSNNLTPSDYQFLIKSLTQGNYVTKAESLKKFNILASSDKKQFSIYCKRIVLAIQDLMFQPKQDINLLSSTLALQIININPREIQYYIRSKLLKCMVKNLGDAKPQIRKTSHYCLLAYVKTYKSFDELILVYITNGIISQQWQLRQKSINSLQSILIMEMKYLNWGSNQFKKVFQILLTKLKDQSAYVQKAAEQCLLSLSKMQEIRTFSKKLSSSDFQILKNFSQSQLQSGNLQQIKLDMQQKVIPNNRMFYQLRQDSLKALNNTENSLLNFEKIRLAQQSSQKRAIINRIQQIKRTNSTYQTPKIQKQQIQTMRKADSVVIINQLKQMKRKTVQKQKQKISQLKLQPIKKQIKIQKEQIQNKPQKNEKQATITRKLIDDLKNDKDWKIRLQAIEQFQSKFISYKDLLDFDTLIKVYLPILIKLLGDINFKVALIALKIIQDIILIPNVNIQLIVPHLIQKLSDNKIALRQNISKLIKSQYVRTKQNIWIDNLLIQLRKSNNSNTKEQILSIMYKLYQEQQCLSYSFMKVIQTICPLMEDLKTKIKIKTLDLLVLITLKLNEKQQIKNLLMGKLNQVYYEMYSQKLNKETKNKEVQIKQTSLNLSTEQSNHIFSSRGNRANNVINKRYSKNTGNTTSSSLQREKNTPLDPNDTVRTSSFIQRNTKREDLNNKSEQINNISSKISLHDPQISSPSKLNQKKKSLLKSFRKKTHRIADNKSNVDGVQYEPFDDPQKQLKNILIQIKNQDWQINFQALNKIKVLIYHHKQLLNPSILKSIVPDIVRLIQNLRSSLSKNAVTTLNQLSLQIKKGFETQIDMIFTKLIKKSLDTNSFISQEVKKVLINISSNANQNKIITLLTSFHTSRAIPIKQVIVHILQNITFLPKFYEKQLERIVIILNNFMSQGSLEIRQKTKALLSQIINSQKGKQFTKLISPQYLKKIIKQTQQKIPELKIIQKDQIKMEIKFQEKDLKQTYIQSGKKKKQKINTFPDQFNTIQSLLEKCQSSDWKIRSQSMSQIYQIYAKYPSQASQHRCNNKFIDVLTKQIGDPNVRVATNALKIFKNLTKIIPNLIQNNLSVISNEIFACFASQKQDIKILAQQLFDEICKNIQSWMLLQHICNGILYGIQKSKVIIIQKLINIVPSSLKSKPNIFQKNVYSMINKTVQEGKPQMLIPLKKLLTIIYDEIGQNCMDHLKPKSKLLMKQ